MNIHGFPVSRRALVVLYASILVAGLVLACVGDNEYRAPQTPCAPGAPMLAGGGGLLTMNIRFSIIPYPALRRSAARRRQSSRLWACCGLWFWRARNG